MRALQDESVALMHTRMDKIENLLSSVAENIMSSHANQNIINHETKNRDAFIMNTLKAVQDDLKQIIPLKQIANIEGNLLSVYQMNDYTEFFNTNKYIECFKRNILMNENIIKYM